MNPIHFQSASELATAIRQHKLSSVEVTKAYLARIKEHNESLNAVVILREEEALERANQMDVDRSRDKIWGPLHGVPITVKEAFEMKGLKTTVNFKMLKDHVSKRDSVHVENLHNAGAVILGKTNVPTLLADWQTNGPIYGRANNPYNLDHTPGGSTGGGAAAVAAGLSSLSLGSDIGGSIRIPSHFCGLYGLKPTENALPMRGHVPPLPGSKSGVVHMATSGPLARSVEDLRMAFQILAGPDVYEPAAAPINWDWLEPKPVEYLRIAWTDTFGGFTANKETVNALQELVGKLEGAGAKVEKKCPEGFDFHKAWEVWGKLFGFIMGQDTPWAIRQMLRFRMWRNPDPTVKASGKGISLNPLTYTRALRQRRALIAIYQSFFKEVDCWLCPVSMTPAFTHRKQSDPFEVDGKNYTYSKGGGAFTTVFNCTGSPVVVIPVAQSSGGLPIGIQIAGPYWSDMKLLDIAEKIAAFTPGFVPPPNYL